MNGELRGCVAAAMKRHLQDKLARAIERKLWDTKRFHKRNRPEIHEEYGESEVYLVVGEYDAEQMYQTVVRHNLDMEPKWREGLVNLAMMEDLKWDG